jgi:hypothetical protein
MMGDQLVGNLVLVWLAAFAALVALAWGLERWLKWRRSFPQRLLE